MKQSLLTSAATGRGWTAALRHCGMAGVLVLLCAFFAAITVREQQPVGAEAAANGVAQFNRGGLPG